MSENVRLVINNDEYIGWEEVSITRSIEEAASSFRVMVSNPPYDGDNALDIEPGDVVQVYYGDELLLTGYIDSTNTEYSADSHTISIEGRSKTKDLIDCSALNTSQFKGQTLLQIAKSLCEPYNIDVKIEPEDSKPIADFQVNSDGESVFSALDRLAKSEEYVLTDNPEGDLVITRIGKKKSANTIIVKDRKINTNVLSASIQIGEHQRYSKIVVKGQQKSTDKNYGKAANQVAAEVLDPEIQRTRVKVVVADVDLTPEKASQHAHWQMKAQAGKGTEITYTIQDWRGNGDEIWRENTLVEVNDSIAYIDGRQLIIARVEYNISNSGTTATLTLNPPELFEKDPDDKPKKQGKIKPTRVQKPREEKKKTQDKKPTETKPTTPVIQTIY